MGISYLLDLVCYFGLVKVLKVYVDSVCGEL